MTKKEMCTNSQIAADKLSMPFLQALMKIPNQIKNMEWDEYLVSLSSILLCFW